MTYQWEPDVREQKIWDVGPTLVYCWVTVYDTDLTVNQRWANVSCVLGVHALCMTGTGTGPAKYSVIPRKLTLVCLSFLGWLSGVGVSGVTPSNYAVIGCFRRAVLHTCCARHSNKDGIRLSITSLMPSQHLNRWTSANVMCRVYSAVQTQKAVTAYI